MFYVAITRAKRRLFLSFATTRFRWGQFIESQASRFLSELDEKCVDKQEISLIDKDYKPYKIYPKTKYVRKEPLSSSHKSVFPKKLKMISKTKNLNNAGNLNNIKNGMQVEHNKFGKGKVLNISGEGSNKKATIFFNGIGQKQLLLKFARLEILN